MTWHPLDDSHDNAKRAKEHLDELAAEITQFVDANREALHIDHGFDGRHNLLKIPRVIRLPGRWGTKVTEIANNARQALDYLVFQLAIVSGGDPEAHQTAFPIAVDRDEYWQRPKAGRPNYRDRSMRGVDEKWKREIDEFQPYNRTKSPTTHPLATLNRLNNRGKHRTRNLPHLMFDTPTHRFSLEGRDEFRDVTIRYGAEYAELQGAFTAGDRHPGVIADLLIYPKQHLDGKLGVGVAFGDERAGLGDIEDVIDVVGVILKRLEPAFEPIPNP